jgi:hypothetical protein
MAEKPGQNKWTQWSAALEAALRETQASLASGEAQEAERRAKAVSAFAKAIRDAAELADYARTMPPEEDIESIRTELRRRIARYADAATAGAGVDELASLARDISQV